MFFFFFFILASLLDREMHCVNWLPPKTIVCFIKSYFGAVQLSIVSPTEWLERLWLNNIKWRWCRWVTGLFCLGRICFPGLIYYDRTWVLFLGVQIRLLTRCKICCTLGLSNYFSLKSLSPLPQTSHECALKLTDLWITSLLFDLNLWIY